MQLELPVEELVRRGPAPSLLTRRPASKTSSEEEEVRLLAALVE